MDKNPRSQNQNNMDLRANNSKTVQCMQYKMGNCSFGQNCRYAHLNGPNSNMSKHDADKCRSDGVCIVPKCRNRADEYKNDGVCIVPKCRKFWNGEFCAFGKKCYFLHDEPAATKKGFWKTRVCYKWEETGSCPYGRVCCYAHGRNELLKSRSQFDVQHEVNSNSRKRSATAAPREPYSGTANVPVSGQDKKKYVFNSDKKIKGIYADWIDETPYEPKFGMNSGSVCVTNNVC